eukprot:Nk52_evm12s261 gene=Nk52_evmTU12s261
MPKQIICAVDESDNSWYALNYILNSGLYCTGDMITLLTCVNKSFSAYGTALNGNVASKQSYDTADNKSKGSSAKRAIQEYQTVCRQAGVPAECVRPVALKGDARMAIVQYCDEHNSLVDDFPTSVLVMGSRGLGSIKRAFLGSVSDYCVKHCKCPVMVIKVPEEN